MVCSNSSCFKLWGTGESESRLRPTSRQSVAQSGTLEHQNSAHGSVVSLAPVRQNSSPRQCLERHERQGHQHSAFRSVIALVLVGPTSSPRKCRPDQTPSQNRETNAAEACSCFHQDLIRLSRHRKPEPRAAMERPPAWVLTKKATQQGNTRAKRPVHAPTSFRLFRRLAQ